MVHELNTAVDHAIAYAIGGGVLGVEESTGEQKTDDDNTCLNHETPPEIKW
jgi:hypothetical protein